MELFGEPVTMAAAFLLFCALALALSFEFVNGFHDTANAVATVIYTNSLKPVPAVIWSGVWNFLGVTFSSGAVAFGIIALLPVELVLNVASSAGFAMVFALLFAAILWNVGTWYLGLPASSSHTLIGSILGVGMANAALLEGNSWHSGVNWPKAREVFAALLVSPVFGFMVAGGLFLLTKALIKNPELYSPPQGDKPPPFWIRSVLIGTCTGVSFAHGSNDGQKGMGLIMLILIGILPGAFALNPALPAEDIREIVEASQQFSRAGPPVETLTATEATAEVARFVQRTARVSDKTAAALHRLNTDLRRTLEGKTSLSQIPRDDRRKLRTSLFLLTEASSKLTSVNGFASQNEADLAASLRSRLDPATKFIPAWVKLAVALALGIGTMVGWKRIVVTVGEKIGKAHLTYAQGAAAEMVAMGTIGVADVLGLPVSTTHVLSSGVAGTMAANRSGVQGSTIRNLAIAWVLTLPVTMALSAILFALGLQILKATSLLANLGL